MNFSDLTAGHPMTPMQLLVELETSKRIIYALVLAAGGEARVSGRQLHAMTPDDALLVSAEGDAYVLKAVKKQSLLEPTEKP